MDEFCKNKMAHQLGERDIDRTHWVGKRSGDKPCAIIVRFKSHGDKKRLVKCKKTLKGSGYYINEDLTKINQKLFYTARNECKNVASAWATDGKVFVKHLTHDKIYRIITFNDFAKFGLM